ncbi:MAG TPA: Zn-ribbon containing protein [candidate division Zixibacteria bacterium]|nr:Zn-ribbon containing protein [candidate division Zixibacteria bacterium]
MEFVCGKCNAPLEKTSELLMKGCSKCGSKVFTTITTTEENQSVLRTIPKVQREQMDEYITARYEIIPRLIERVPEEYQTDEIEHDNIPAVKLRKKGIYEVNLDSLFRDKKSDPIVLSGKQGIYRIEIVPSKQD